MVVGLEAVGDSGAAAVAGWGIVVGLGEVTATATAASCCRGTHNTSTYTCPIGKSKPYTADTVIRLI